VEADRIFVVDGPVWTSAGMTTGIDLALAMVEQDLATFQRKNTRSKSLI
jgi:transcriptional regulator GlxA family with amidase domain